MQRRILRRNLRGRGVRGLAGTLVLGLSVSAISASPVFAQADATKAEAQRSVKANKAPVEAFGNLPDVSNIQISPDGAHYAIVRRFQSRNVVVLIKRGDERHPAGFRMDDGIIRNVYWITNDWALMEIDESHFTEFYAGDTTQFSRLASVSADGKQRNYLMSRVPITQFDTPRLTQHVGLLSPHVVEGDKVLVTAWTGDARHVFLASLRSPVARQLKKGWSRSTLGTLQGYTSDWMVNHDHTAWLRWNEDARERPAKTTVEVKLGDDDWRTIDSYAVGDTPGLGIEGFGDRPGLLYVTADRVDGPPALYEYDLAAGKLGKLIYAHPSASVGANIDWRTGKLIAATYMLDEPQQHVIDPERQRLQRLIDEAFKDTSVNRIISETDDGKDVIVETSGPSAPAIYYHLDTEKLRADELGQAYPDLLDVPLGKVSALTYKARDGLEIRAYLTVPPGVEAKKLPTVILPHGGPHARDTMTFDYMAQFLANRGYAVFQPNFRGSTGYGEAFVKAGYGEWGGKMQDDVTDGVGYLVEHGVADPARICIMGASYGGYAALMGGVKTPDLYRCVISINGVTDLVDMMDDEHMTTAHEFWKISLGHDKDRLEANSPARHVESIKAPVLLVHGKKDQVVDYDQAKTMLKALRGAGKSVKLVTLDGEDHFLSNGETRIAALKAVEEFLTEHLGPGVQ